MSITGPMSNLRGDYGYPHDGMAMKGDISRMDALVQPNAAADDRDNHDRIEKESKDMGGSPPGSANEGFDVGADQPDQFDTGYQSSLPSPMKMPWMYPNMNSPDKASANLPQAQARQMDAIFRDQQSPASPASWSTVVSSTAPPSSPLGMTTRSSSGETLLTSNATRPLLNLQPLSAAESHSFEHEMAPRDVPRAYSFGSSADASHYGIPPSHPGHSSFKDSAPSALAQTRAPQGAPPPYPASPFHESKPRSSSLGTYSPVSLGDSSSMRSMTTDQTSPMSSPSLSPHISPATHPSPRRHGHGDGPPAWHLSDGDYHSEPSFGPRPLSRLPRSIPEHRRHEPEYGHRRWHDGPPGGPMSPPRHSHSAGSGFGASGSHAHHAHHRHGHGGPPTYHPRGPGGPKPYGAASSHVPLHHRSSTEILKTLLRKKACLYEPETSLAVALATWLVGGRLAAAHGYFPRQRLQAGVHSLVAPKIAEGRVTRTKVNRCMQVVLNSCFHYIIPRPDGSEERGEAFRGAFAREAAEEEHLLGTLPPPWDGLSLGRPGEEVPPYKTFQEGEDAEIAGTRPRADSFSASLAGDNGSDGGKRPVLLCFNENIRCAADVFRCHNEFIRDVAHTGNLTLSSEDWRSFFAGTNARVRRTPPDGSLRSGFRLADVCDRADRRGLSELRTSWCAKRYDHDHSFCAFAHVDVNRGWLRRNPFLRAYAPVMCPRVRPLPGARGNYYVNACHLGVDCDRAHSEEEILYHPENYGRRPCAHLPGACPLGDICPDAHAETSSPRRFDGYDRRGKRGQRGPDQRSPHRVGRASASGGHAGGFERLPDGSPMLYVDPAPVSEFERTLSLPGLQALFRDHSHSVVYSNGEEGTPYEYGMFGYRKVPPKRTAILSSDKTIGRPTND